MSRRTRRSRQRRARKARRLERRAERQHGTPICARCGKLAWQSFELARQQLNHLKGQAGMRRPDLLDAYRCPAGNGWHIGHNYKLQWLSLCIGEHK